MSFCSSQAQLQGQSRFLGALSHGVLKTSKDKAQPLWETCSLPDCPYEENVFNKTLRNAISCMKLESEGISVICFMIAGFLFIYLPVSCSPRCSFTIKQLYQVKMRSNSADEHMAEIVLPEIGHLRTLPNF